jgi:hypothetical protein
MAVFISCMQSNGMNFFKNIFSSKLQEQTKSQEPSIKLFSSLPVDIKKKIVEYMRFNDLERSAQSINNRFALSDQGDVCQKSTIVLYAQDVIAFNVYRDYVIGLQYLLEEEHVSEANFLIAKKGTPQPIDTIEFLPKIKNYSFKALMSSGPFAISANAQQIFFIQSVDNDVFGVWKVKDQGAWKIQEKFNLTEYGEFFNFRNVCFFEELDGIGIITNSKKVFISLKPENQESLWPSRNKSDATKNLKDAGSDILSQYFAQKRVAKNIENSLKITLHQ